MTAAGPTLRELADRELERRARAVTLARRLGAELEVLEAFDLARHGAGHDYGGGQRRRELLRVEDELRDARRQAERLGAANVGHDRADVAKAFRRLIGAKVRRLEREPYRHRTPAGRAFGVAVERTRRELELPPTLANTDQLGGPR